MHRGHVAIALAALEEFALDEVWLMPCVIPPHKETPAEASAADRLEMARLAVAEAADPRLRVCDAEFRLPVPSYSLRTVEALRRERPEADWSFVIGLDTLRQLHTWYHIGELLELVSFLTLGRPGETLPAPGELRLPPPWPERLLAAYRDGPQVDASSTAIRRELAEKGESPLVHRAVLAYIRDHNLYSTRMP